MVADVWVKLPGPVNSLADLRRGMAKTITPPSVAAPFYRAGVTSAAQKWFAKTKAATGVADAAKSDAAEASYAAGVGAAVANRTRQKKLAKITDADIKAGVDAVGAAGYSSAASAKTDKWAKNFAPYVPALQAAVNALPPKSSDAAQNVAARVTPIAVALQNAKRTGV